MSALVNIFFFFALLPFISPLPTTADVQLPAFVVGVVIIARDVVKGKFRLEWIEIAFLAVAIWSFAYVLPSREFIVRQRVGLLMAFIAYFVVKKHAQSFSPRTLMLATLMALAGALAQMLAPSVFEVYAPRIIRTVKGIENNRGVAGLSAEPSFLAAMGIVQGLVALRFYRLGRVSRRWLAVNWAMAIGIVLLSRSATGFVYLFLVCAIFMAYYALRGLHVVAWVGIALLVAVVAFVITGPLAFSRGGVVVVDAINDPFRVIADASLQERAVSLFLGVVAVPDYPLGVGGDGYREVALEMAKKYEAPKIFESVRQEIYGGVLSSFGLYAAELGLVFLVFFGVILIRSFALDPLNLSYIVLALFFVAATFSITCPFIWLMLGLGARSQSRRDQARSARAA